MNKEQTALVEDNLDLADKVAKILSKGTNFYETFHSVALEYLCKAAIDWDETKMNFQSYAHHRMFNGVIDCIRKETHMNRKTKEVAIKIYATDVSEMISIRSTHGSQNEILCIDTCSEIKSYMNTLSPRNKDVLIDMANGGGKYAAKRNGITEGRVSQIRKQAVKDWEDFSKH